MTPKVLLVIPGGRTLALRQRLCSLPLNALPFCSRLIPRQNSVRVENAAPDFLAVDLTYLLFTEPAWRFGAERRTYSIPLRPQPRRSGASAGPVTATHPVPQSPTRSFPSLLLAIASALPKKI